jgi:hypothetical protein
MRDLFDVLVRDHRELQALLWDLEWVSEHGDSWTATHLFSELACGLVQHADLEERVCAAVEWKNPELSDRVKATRLGHRRAAELIMNLCAHAPGEAQWREHLVALRDMLDAHMSFEEHELFPTASRYSACLLEPEPAAPEPEAAAATPAS